ncbi:cytochrome c nitrite reductase subunit NrfD, partial [Aeromonas hydrophila]
LLGRVGSPAKAHQPARLVLICSLSLVGILLLRYFILYAGQMTVM